MSIINFTTSAITVLAMGAASLGSAVAQTAPPPVPMTLVIYEAGPEWKQGLPPEKQDLASHFKYVGEQFAAGKVIAFGPQTDAVRGYYVLSGAGGGEAEAFIHADPGVSAKVFTPISKLGWGVAVNGFQTNVKGDSYFILRYAPGPKWVKGKPVTEQDIGAHFGYMIDQAKKGTVLAAGPAMSGEEGLYVVHGDKAKIDALVAADPGVTAGIFQPQMIGWNVLAMQSTK